MAINEFIGEHTQAVLKALTTETRNENKRKKPGAETNSNQQRARSHMAKSTCTEPCLIVNMWFMQSSARILGLGQCYSLPQSYCLHWCEPRRDWTQVIIGC